MVVCIEKCFQIFVLPFPRCRDSRNLRKMSTLWHRFFAKTVNILKTAILTLGMIFVTVTAIKKLRLCFGGNHGKYL